MQKVAYFEVYISTYISGKPIYNLYIAYRCPSMVGVTYEYEDNGVKEILNYYLRGETETDGILSDIE